MHMINSVKTDS